MQAAAKAACIVESARKRLFRADLLPYALSVIDQGVVSGSRFATTLCIGYFCGAAELGNYALGLSLLILVQTLQTSLITRPYTHLAHSLDSAAQKHLAGNSLLGQLAFVSLTSLLFAGLFAAASNIADGSRLTSVLLALMVTAPCFLFREHARQHCFAHLKPGIATGLDVVACGGHLVTILVLAATGHLNATTAIMAMSIPYGIAAVIWLISCRSLLAPSLSSLSDHWRQHWLHGKWDCASEFVFACQLHGMTWIIAAMLGDAAVGVYAACALTIQVMNPFLMGVGSVLLPKASAAFASGGPAGLHQVVVSITKTFGIVTGLFATVAALLGPYFLSVIYAGKGFDIPPGAIPLLAFGLFVEVVGSGPEAGIWAIGRHVSNFRLNGLGLIVTVSTALVAITFTGLLGAMIAFFAGRLATSVTQWVVYLRELRDIGFAPDRTPFASATTT